MKTIYQIGLYNFSNSTYVFLVAPLITLLIIIYLIPQKKNLKKIIPAVFAFVIGVTGGISGVYSHRLDYNNFNDGNYATVEGVISNSHKDAKENILYTVSNKNFTILTDHSFGSISGPLKDGIRAKIYYSPKSIDTYWSERQGETYNKIYKIDVEK